MRFNTKVIFVYNFRQNNKKAVKTYDEYVSAVKQSDNGRVKLRLKQTKESKKKK